MMCDGISLVRHRGGWEWFMDFWGVTVSGVSSKPWSSAEGPGLGRGPGLRHVIWEYEL